MLKQYLQFKLSQKLSPQQIQLMKLIQLPTQAFEQRINQELEENPALDTGKEETNEDKMDEFARRDLWSNCVVGSSHDHANVEEAQHMQHDSLQWAGLSASQQQRSGSSGGMPVQQAANRRRSGQHRSLNGGQGFPFTGQRVFLRSVEHVCLG